MLLKQNWQTCGKQVELVQDPGRNSIYRGMILPDIRRDMVGSSCLKDQTLQRKGDCDVRVSKNSRGKLSVDRSTTSPRSGCIPGVIIFIDETILRCHFEDLRWSSWSSDVKMTGGFVDGRRVMQPVLCAY